MTKSSACLAFLFAAYAVPASAQDPGSGNGQRDMPRQKMQERLQQMDTDGNGAISRAEFMAQAERRFSKMDTDGDGQITENERVRMQEKLGRINGSKGLRDEQFP